MYMCALCRQENTNKISFCEYNLFGVLFFFQITDTSTRVRDYRESKRRFRNDVVTTNYVWGNYPLKRNAPFQKILQNY